MGITKKQQEGVVHILNDSVKVVNAAFFHIIYNMLGRKNAASFKHFVHQNINLIPHRVICSGSRIDKISALVQRIFRNQLLEEIAGFLGIIIPISAVVPARAARNLRSRRLYSRPFPA